MLKRDIKNKDSFLDFLNNFIYLHITKKTAEILAELKLNYDNKGLKLPLADLLIAAQTKENNFTLVTKDSHFETIEEIEKIIL